MKKNEKINVKRIVGVGVKNKTNCGKVYSEPLHNGVYVLVSVSASVDLPNVSINE